MALTLCISLICGCATVKFDGPKTQSRAILDTDNTTLGAEVSRWVELNGGTSGVYPLVKGMDALGVRLHLADKAEKGIDLQYFLMKNDKAGAVIIQALLNAADRGVRIRFLLDDVLTSADDRALLLLDQHQNIEVRFFNPVSRRGWALLNFLADYRRANRRMHNKSFTVDNQYSVVGGRNIADEYFQLIDKYEFLDFDVLVAGPVVKDISYSFDHYWNHSRSVPIDQVGRIRPDETLETAPVAIKSELNEIYENISTKALESTLIQDLINGKEPFYPSKVRVLADSPDKLINEIDVEQRQLANDLAQVLKQADNEVLFITPYFVPGDSFVNFLEDLVEKGVRVILLTNSLASTNHIPVHSAYARYRKNVIRAGVELYETRVNAAGENPESDSAPRSMTLHTKAIMFDGKQLFVGSLNLDPRSVDINSEFGLLVDSADLVSPMVTDIKNILPERAYRVLLNKNGSLEWHGIIENRKVVEHSEPMTTRWRRVKAWLSKVLPEQQL